MLPLDTFGLLVSQGFYVIWRSDALRGRVITTQFERARRHKDEDSRERLGPSSMIGEMCVSGRMGDREVEVDKLERDTNCYHGDSIPISEIKVVVYCLQVPDLPK
jgi:hypothetical protein